MIPDNTSRKTTSVQRARSLQYCRGRCLGSAARDAKKMHHGQPPLHVGPPILLFYYFTVFLFHSRYSTAAADVWGWPPEMQKCFPRTTTYYHIYYHVLQQNVVFASRTAPWPPLCLCLSFARVKEEGATLFPRRSTSPQLFGEAR